MRNDERNRMDGRNNRRVWEKRRQNDNRNGTRKVKRDEIWKGSEGEYGTSGRR